MADSNAEVTIRPIRDEDIGKILQITGEVFESSSVDARIEKMIGVGGANWRTVKCETVKKELIANPEGCFVAEIDGEVIGYISTFINETASRGTVANIAVLASCQGRSVGRRLIERALSYFRDLHLAQAKIETLVPNEAGNHLYPAVGFQEVVRQIHFIMPLDQD